MVNSGRSLAVVIGAMALGITTSALAAEAQHGEAAFSCMNVSSGATWLIKVDYDHGTVDSNPARISDTEISWRDRTDGWNYTLDLKSGKLTVIVASSTGGNMLFDRCKLGN
jgi:hypothetical protein